MSFGITLDGIRGGPQINYLLLDHTKSLGKFSREAFGEVLKRIKIPK